MSKDKEQDCAYALLDLVGKPKAWRLEASKVLIEYGHKFKTLKLEVGAVIGLCALILGIIVKNSLGI